MRRPLQFSDIRLIGAILVIGFTLVASSYVLVDRTVDHWVEHDAEEEAHSWARSFASQLHDLESIAQGNPPSVRSLEFIRTVRNIGRVFRFKIFDKNGDLRLVSDALGQINAGGTGLNEHNEKAASIVSSAISHTEIKTGTQPQQPDLYVETYLPVVINGHTVAILEVYIDQTQKAAHFRADVTETGVWLTLLASLAFCVPYGAFLFRNRQKRHSDARLQFLAHHDPMTHVLNRAAFVDKLEETLSKSAARGESIAVHYIDLDHFKAINDTLGHGVGDALIRAFAQRACSTIKTDDLIGRFGGDEFVIAQCGITGGGQATAVAKRLVASLSEPYTLDGHDLAITLSVGCAIAPRDASNANALLQRADLALYYVKSSGRNGHAFYRANMSEELQARRDLEARLKRATLNESFELHFQPVVNSRGGAVTGFEALLRLPNDGGAYISPAVFVPLAESMGLIPQIGAWVLRKACETATTWPEHYTIAVNLSPVQFASDDVADIVASALTETGLAPERLELEITEGLVMNDTEGVLTQIQQLKDLGVAIVMDDFGTGYSSLSYLWRFPFDKIKIDRSFMQAFDESDENVESILTTIVALGHSLKMRVTAEGVETREQAAFMEQLDCDQIQGFLYGRPMPAADIALTILNSLPKEMAEGAADASMTSRSERGAMTS